MKKIIIAIITLVLLLPYAYAYISSDIYLSQDGSATFVGRASNPVSINGIELQNGKLVGVTQQLTTKNGETWTFSISLQDSAELKIFLPENAELKSEISSNLDTLIGSEGRDIVISIAGENPSLVFNYKIINDQKVNYLYIIAAIIVVIAFILLIILLNAIKRKRRKQNKETAKRQKRTRRIDVVKKTLNEREQKIINELLRLKKAKQSFLQRKTEIPKASFSRHIQNLEKKGILIKKGIGKNNLLELNKNML